MPNFAIIVEGAHDASFIGQLLKARGFKSVKQVLQIPEDWKILFPRNFPADGNTLDHVMRFPEVFVQGDVNVGITTSGSESRLISTLRAVIDAISPASLAGIAVYIDTDKHDAAARFTSVQNQIVSMNSAAHAEGQPGYPITVPKAPGVIEQGTPPVGVFLFPNNSGTGALEDILLECAKINHPEIAAAAIALVEDLDQKVPPDKPDLKTLRAGMGKVKAKVGIVANVLKPGASVAVSLAQSSWLHESALQHEFVAGAIAFLKELIGDSFGNENADS